MKEQLFKKILSLLDINPVSKKILSLLEISPDKRYSVLDFGCGNGQLLAMMANILPEGSKLVGVDTRPEVFELTKLQFPDMRFVDWKFVNSLPFSDNTFDMVLSVDAVECIPDKTALVNEFHRVLKPNGKLLVSHWDWDTQVYNSSHKETLRKIILAFSDFKQEWMDDSDGQMGRKLWALFEGSKKFHGRMEPYSLIETVYEKGSYGHDRMQGFASLVKQGQIDEGDYNEVRKEMELLNDNMNYFYSVTAFIYCGQKNS